MELQIGFEQKSKILHAYHIPGLHDQLVKIKDSFLLDFYNRNDKQTSPSNTLFQVNVKVSDGGLNSKLNNMFSQVIYHYYQIEGGFNSPNTTTSTIAIYIQNKEQSVSAYHHHFHQGSLVCTTYIDPPNKGEGGELEIWDMPYPPMKIQPLKNVIYTFPSWLPHRPLPQISKKDRICLNWVLKTNKRLTHKITSDLW